jgi:FkbM family methyltransferase
MPYPLIKYSICELVNILDVKTVLDIGCNQGHWAEIVTNCVPKTNIVCVDGNCNHKNAIDSKGFRFVCACLSDKEKEVSFYSNPHGDSFSTGRSYYLETTQHFNADCYETIVTQTLDKIFSDDIFDMIKMDIQGAELDALIGGKTLISKSKCLVLETATGLYDYNKGSPTQDMVVEWLKHNSFTPICSIDDLPYNGVVAHQDVLFVANDYLNLFDKQP